METVTETADSRWKQETELFVGCIQMHFRSESVFGLESGVQAWDEESLYFANAIDEKDAREIFREVARENYPNAQSYRVLTIRKVHNTIAVARNGVRYNIAARTTYTITRD